MKTIVKMDDKGRIVIPLKFRGGIESSFFELRREGDKLILVEIEDPLDSLSKIVSRPKPSKPLDVAAEEEALKSLKE